MTPNVAHRHPDLRDDEYRRRFAGAVHDRRCLAQEGCTRPATHTITLTFPDTLADIPVPTCTHHQPEMVERCATCPNCRRLASLRRDAIVGAFRCEACGHRTLNPGTRPIEVDKHQEGSQS